MINCGNCKEDKSPKEFCRSSVRKTGRQYHCKKCQSEINLRRYHAKLKKDPSYKEKKKAYDKSRRELVGDDLRAYDRERAKLPHRKAAHNEQTRRRRAMLKDSVPDNYDKEGVASMYKLAQKLSVLTGVEMHVDHIVPIANGGIHDVSNLQLLERTLNVSKGASERTYLPQNELSWKKYPK